MACCRARVVDELGVDDDADDADSSDDTDAETVDARGFLDESVLGYVMHRLRKTLRRWRRGRSCTHV